MNDLIEKQAAIAALETAGYNFSESDFSEMELEEIAEAVGDIRQDMIARIKQLPSVEAKRKKNAVRKFHDYQVEWLKSHYDVELDPQLEEMIVRFLRDTANCYMMEVGHDDG